MQTQSSAPTVWIVDDDEDDRLFIRSAFRDGQPSISVLTLSDGDELLPKLRESIEVPRLILLDVNMPRKNGFETLKELRQLPGFAHLPVVMLTTSSDEEDRRRSLALGANYFLTKPLSYERLKELAQELSQEWELS
jgi:CheY-like chemotaxis protein